MLVMLGVDRFLPTHMVMGTSMALPTLEPHSWTAGTNLTLPFCGIGKFRWECESCKVFSLNLFYCCHSEI